MAELEIQPRLIRHGAAAMDRTALHLGPVLSKNAAHIIHGQEGTDYWQGLQLTLHKSALSSFAAE
jgi:hypothetical protein